MNKPAKFRVGEVVGLKQSLGYGRITWRGQYSIGRLRLRWHYKVSFSIASDASLMEEAELRRLTKREQP